MTVQLVTKSAYPTEGYARPKHTAVFLGVSEGTIWRKAKEPNFPKPIKLSDRVTVFDAAEIRAWANSKREAA